MPPSVLLVEDTLARVRQRLGLPRAGKGLDLVIRGRALHLGATGTFLWRFGPGGSFVREVDAAATRIVGANQRGAWISQGQAPVRNLEWGEADEARLVAMVLSGDWLLPASGAQTSLLAGDRVRLVLGVREAELAFNSATGEPRALSVRSNFGSASWRFSEHESFSGIVYPKWVEQDLPAGVVNRFEVTSVTLEPSRPEAFEPPTAAKTWRFDPAASPEVGTERSANGYLLVRPEVHGRSVGTFLFDTGAGTNVITPGAARELGLDAIGSSWLGLAAGASAGTVRQAGTMRLGPLHIDRPTFVEMDLAPISAASGVELAGIIGYEVLRRSIVEIEVAVPRITIFDSDTPQDDELPWQDIVIYGNHVYTRGRFENHEGWFRLDTGAPQVPLMFNGPAVERLSLLEGRDTKKAQIDVPGGMMGVEIGEVHGFELAGHVFGSLGAIFPTETTGAFADREALGNLGQECFAPFRVRFDYARKRAAFMKRT